MFTRKRTETFALLCDAPGCVELTPYGADDVPKSMASAAGWACIGDVHLCPNHKAVSAVEVAGAELVLEALHQYRRLP